MTPLGKPAAALTVPDLQRLCDDGVPEGRYLEYKQDISVSEEEQKRQRVGGVQRPVDRSWLSGRSVMDFGRDKLMEELVAFANADGGLLVLGISETNDVPPRAKEITPLPSVDGLERRLRDAIINCIEPRLPYASVRALPVGDGQDGVVLFEIEPSRLGPHRVRKTREATIRREDACVPMTMAEIHDMVLRNARRFDAVVTTLADRSKAFRSNFIDTLVAATPAKHIAISKEGRVDGWFASEKMAAIGIRVTAVPHSDLGIPRLESLADLVPSHKSVYQITKGQQVAVRDADTVWANPLGGRLTLGGVLQIDKRSDLAKSYLVTRDGFVEGSIVFWANKAEVQVPVPWFVGLLACVVGVYDRLRIKAGAPSMPAEIGAEILTRGSSVTIRTDMVSYSMGAAPLEPVSVFPRYTVFDRESFSDFLKEAAWDLANLAGMDANSLPYFGVT